MQNNILGFAALAAAALALTFAAPTSPQAATADSILASKKIERRDTGRRLRASGCTRQSTCVAWEKGIPGTFVGKCKQYAMRWSCPISVH